MTTRPHDPEWTEEHQRASEPTEYKPDWDSIPDEFKYCYCFEHVDESRDAQRVLSVNKIPRYDNMVLAKRIDRSPDLVDGAWYAFTTKGGIKLAGRYEKDFMWVNGGGHNLSNLTIHNRIPDDMWGGE